MVLRLTVTAPRNPHKRVKLALTVAWGSGSKHGGVEDIEIACHKCWRTPARGRARMYNPPHLAGWTRSREYRGPSLSDGRPMIDPVTALSLTASIAVTLTGFTGIVAVFGSIAVHEWDEADRFRLRLLLAGSIAPLALSLLALVMLSADLEAKVVWRAGSILALMVFIFSAADNGRTYRRIGTTKLNALPGGSVVLVSTMGVSIAMAVLQLVNVIALCAFWPFFADVVFWMLMALLQFARLVLLRRSSVRNAGPR
jgi:hypothetical protein